MPTNHIARKSNLFPPVSYKGTYLKESMQILQQKLLQLSTHCLVCEIYYGLVILSGDFDGC